MKILTGKTIRELDLYTIENEPISSVGLMERASEKIAEWINNHIAKENSLYFFVGKGNNGGDGLAVARLLFAKGYKCTVILCFDKKQLSPDSTINLKKLPGDIRLIEKEFPRIPPDAIIIDAILGTGVKGQVQEPASLYIEYINKLSKEVISIDLPSGMKTEFDNKNQLIVDAGRTLTLQFPKIAMLLPEAGNKCGEIGILNIGLDNNFIDAAPSEYRYVTENYIGSILLKRQKFSHKNTQGHILLICGSDGMSGASVLATGGALRSGCGLVTTHLPYSERYALQVNYPSAMLSYEPAGYFSRLPENISRYNAIGIGSGLSTRSETVEVMEQLLRKVDYPMVFDADAINILATHKHLRSLIPHNSIFTPHLGELKRLTGGWESEEEKIRLVKELARQLNSVVVVKGAYTMICSPDGICRFNSTGNSGMAKAGSGDILTGLITGLLGRGYTSGKAAVLGVYAHGKAGDKAAQEKGIESMNSFDLVNHISV